MYFKMNDTFLYFLLLFGTVSASTLKCPEECLCDLVGVQRRVSCEDRNFLDVVNVPIQVNVLSLRGNVIKKLENYCFKNTLVLSGFYKSLTELDLSENNISDMEMFAFRGLEELKVLYLNRNRLQKIYRYLFIYNELLHTIRLSFNNFRSLQDEIFIYHRTLKVLDLSNTQLVQLFPSTFSELPSLEELDLSGNNLIRLQINVIQPMSNLLLLFLNENKWKCNSEMNFLQSWLNDKNVSFHKQCLESKRSEKMIVLQSPTDDFKNEDLRKIWKLEDEIDEIHETEEPDTSIFYYDKNKSFLELFNEKFPSLWSLIIGFQVGLLIGIFTTYFMVSDSCRCRRWKRRIDGNSSRNSRRRRHLLLNNTQMTHTDTPPIIRRQMSGYEAFPRSHSWETGTISEPVTRLLLQDDNEMRFITRVRTETPPPPYSICADDSIENATNENIDNSVANGETVVENDNNN